jgi:5-aminolevulinate synthase
MDGDIAPIREIVEVCEAHGAMTYIDEVHAVGMYGPRGGGVTEREGLAAPHRPDRGHAGQGLGVVGGYITGSAALCDFIRSFASGFIFTTALPPAVAAAAPPRSATSSSPRSSGAAPAPTRSRGARRLDRAGIPHMATTATSSR